LTSNELCRGLVRQALRSALSSLLGEQSLRVLEFHLNRILGGSLYDVFYDDPHRFYKAIRGFFGSGADSVIELVASKLMEEGFLSADDPREFLELLRSSDDRSPKKLRELFKASGGV